MSRNNNSLLRSNSRYTLRGIKYISYKNDASDGVSFTNNSFFKPCLLKLKGYIDMIPGDLDYYDPETCCTRTPNDLWQAKISFRFYNYINRYNFRSYQLLKTNIDNMKTSSIYKARKLKTISKHFLRSYGR